jgi:hypothetical protein
MTYVRISRNKYFAMHLAMLEVIDGRAFHAKSESFRHRCGSTRELLNPRWQCPLDQRPIRQRLAYHSTLWHGAFNVSASR